MSAENQITKRKKKLSARVWHTAREYFRRHFTQTDLCRRLSLLLGCSLCFLSEAKLLRLIFRRGSGSHK